MVSNPPVLVRAAVADDLPRMMDIVQSAYQPYVARMGRRPAPMDRDLGDDVLAGNVRVVELSDTVVGLVVLHRKPDHLLLENLAVAPGHQGRGLGGQLLTRAEDRARDLGLQEVRLYTNVAMTENQAIYRGRGYRETGRGEQDGFQRVQYAKSLGAPRG